MKNRTETEFIGFPKISRYSRECVVTEKMDNSLQTLTERQEKKRKFQLTRKGIMVR